ncbi:tRNA lysidine(34) synthetase TilS [Pseudahrensia aquimaris]|uniref:tRNA(Ile)-lysidine synthase n=1 Tax=Pseudahrensia aquimaris TaxID=744461 RepID=A0ABW3FHV2_9HYPH
MLLKPSGKVLVAISGGSDSTALLHMLRETIAPADLFAATVDHGLRPTAKDEAKQVSRWCADLGVPHETLTWRPKGNRNGESARLARYALLADHARKCGVKTIAVGHTLDDQAETVFMRALRSRTESGTIGLSGMSEHTAYDELTIWRPLIGQRRAALRAFLQAEGIGWLDDPTNREIMQERIRIRHTLGHSPDNLAEKIARMAELGQRDRLWLSERVAEVLIRCAQLKEDGSLELTVEPDMPRRLLREAFSLLIMSAGGSNHRPALSKFGDCVDCAVSQGRMAKTVARVLVTVSGRKARFEREARHLGTGSVWPKVPFQRFRGASDDPVFAVLSELIGQTRST